MYVVLEVDRPADPDRAVVLTPFLDQHEAVSYVVRKTMSKLAWGRDRVVEQIECGHAICEGSWSISLEIMPL